MAGIKPAIFLHLLFQINNQLYKDREGGRMGHLRNQ
jgi:hypothetical protein